MAKRRLFAADHVSRVANEIGAVRSTYTSQYASLFLAVARDPGKGPLIYAKVVGLKQPLACRILLDLAGRSQAGAAPLGLLAQQCDPEDRRKHRYVLTRKGHALRDRLFASPP